MEIGVSNKVIARNNLGRFIAECEIAGHRTIERAIDEGAQMSRREAPRGSKHDPRTVPLKDSIVGVAHGTSGYWYSFARHALPQELGATPHPITGSPELSFFWEEEGRNWIPASIYYKQPGLVDVINHPGNAPQPFLRPAYEYVMLNVVRWAKRYYPG